MDFGSFIGGTATEVSDDSVETVRDYGFYRMSKLVHLSLPAATSIGQYAFETCSALGSVSLPKVEKIGQYAFQRCSSLESVVLPAVTNFGGNVFAYCTALKVVDIHKRVAFSYDLFKGSNALITLILRATDRISAGVNTQYGPFGADSPIVKGTGYIYVPASLLDTYKADAYWSAFSGQFRALESYTVDGTTTGELDASKI